MATPSITAIIVTYNRKQDLIRCLKAVSTQTVKLSNIVIVDNNSQDGTIEAIASFFSIRIEKSANEELQCLKRANDTCVYLIQMAKNTGGSGGFYKGLKESFEQLQTDYYWLMDDDGYPTDNCLEMLLAYSNRYDYIMPTSIDIDNHAHLSWSVRKKNRKKTIIYDELKSSWGTIMDYVTPFNGVMLSKRCVADVGYINKDFFLWGDEYEHYWRCVKHGIFPVTLLSAKFYHPAQKLPLVKICFGLFRVPYVDSPLRMVCLARNYTYIYLHYNQKIKIPIKWILYWWLFIVTRRFDFAGWNLYKEAVRDGFRGDFTRHLQYLS